MSSQHSRAYQFHEINLNFFSHSFRFVVTGGYSSLLTPTQRRFSYAGSYRKSNSVESSRVFCAYPINESFDYYMESDGDEADDEFDQITSSNDDRVQRLSTPQGVSDVVF